MTTKPKLSRREFLTGLLSSAAVISAGPIAKIIPVDEPYGISPMMHALPELQGLRHYIEEMTRHIEHQLLFGNKEWTPMEFYGLNHLMDIEDDHETSA